MYPVCSRYYGNNGDSRIGWRLDFAMFRNVLPEATLVKELGPVIKRFPMQELAIRRHYASDPDFREACEDYVTANRSLERWQADDAKAAEFRATIEEIELEIIEYLENTQRRPNKGEESCE
jgi:hypothetical protein